MRFKQTTPRASNPTVLSTLKGKGRIRTRRINVVATSWDPISFNDKMDYLVLRNDGANDIKIRFGSAPPAQFYTLKSGETLPSTIKIKDNVTMLVRSNGGPSTLEMLLWS
jgi:hypothetical protein